ncbi:MAG: acyl-CoA dehydrogenase family protein [Rhodococcus sp. (in: high G+C Gram-positive bacteria)]
MGRTEGRVEKSEAETVDSFRRELREWLSDNLAGPYAGLVGLGGPGREHEAFPERLAWDRHLAASGWTCLGWPVEHGGRELPVMHQVVFHEEYARAGAPARVGHIGEELLGPTLIAFGTDAQRTRFLPPIAGVDELWCQGYSEPGAGSDLAAVSTSAELDGEEWVVDGQKVWTSLAHLADWAFVVARTEKGSSRHAGLSYLLVPMKQDGVTVRPITQLTGTSEFNEVFFDGARTPRDFVVGEPGRGWTIAMKTLGFERGVSTLGQQVGFARELDGIVAVARRNGSIDDPLIRDRLTRAWIGLKAMRAYALSTLGGTGSNGEDSVSKLLWANWHRGLGELAMEVVGAPSMSATDGELDEWQRLYLFTRADTIYGGSNEIQRNIISERVLGLPREARP